MIDSSKPEAENSTWASMSCMKVIRQLLGRIKNNIHQSDQKLFIHSKRKISQH